MNREDTADDKDTGSRDQLLADVEQEFGADAKQHLIKLNKRKYVVGPCFIVPSYCYSTFFCMLIFPKLVRIVFQMFIGCTVGIACFIWFTSDTIAV